MWSLLGKKISGFSGSFEGTSQYQIIELLGAGGMGSVYKAKLKGVNGFEKIVAIKTLLDKYTNDPKFVARFIEEAKMVANLIHENIVQIYQLNRTKAGYYFVLEFVDGVSLHDFLEFHQKIRAAMPPELAVFVAARIARGLAYAHSRKDPDGNLLNIVHCDVCTHNIMINSEGVPKIMDFGIAKAVTGETVNAAVIGSVHYISPEQARSGIADNRSDLYSLGISMYEMITGHVPYEGENTVNVVMAHLSEAMVPPAVENKEIYPALNDIILKACRKKPEERYQSAEELIADLKRCVREPEGHFVAFGETLRKSEGKQEMDPEASGNGAEGTLSEKQSGEAAPDQGAAEGSPEQPETDQIQRLMKYGSIAAGVIILGILLMIIGRVSGVFSAVQPANASGPISMSSLLTVTVSSAVQPLNVFLAMTLTASGMTIDFSDVQPANTLASVVTETDEVPPNAVSDSGSSIALSAS